MDSDFFDEFDDEKKNKGRSRENHRWTEGETIRLLKCIAKMLKEPDAQFERPTSRVFYEKMKQKYCNDCELTSNVLKSKMRHLKSSYMKAVEWKDTVGLELYDSDQKHVNARIKSICPYYNLLDDIFGSISNSDPIGFRLPETHADEETMFSDCISKPAKRARGDNTETLIVPKMEAFNDEQSDVGDETYDTVNYEYGESYNDTCPSNAAFTAKRAKHSNVKSSNESLEERTFELEKQKFQLTYRLESRRVSLEEKKFKFEREKFDKLQKMRKYEIDKQFAIKKKEIESDERLKLLELGKSAREMSYDHDVADGEACSEFTN